MIANGAPPAQQLNDGTLVGASDGATYPFLNPATGVEIGQAPDGTADDMEAAIAAARRAFDETDWSTDHALRVRCLRQLHEALVEHGEEFRARTTAEVGAPAFLTAGPQYDVPVAAFRWVVDLMEGYDWETDLGVASPMGVPTRRTIRREAVGVVAAITPWNFPNQINLAKIGPALAAGNTVVLKPAPDTPWVAAELGRLVAEHTDMPPGVLNIVTPRDNAVAGVLATGGDGPDRFDLGDHPAGPDAAFSPLFRPAHDDPRADLHRGQRGRRQNKIDVAAGDEGMPHNTPP